MAFRKGSEAAEQAAQYVRFAKTEFFKLDPGKQTILRFITDVPSQIVVDQHQGVPTKAKPEGSNIEKWPESLPAVCRHDEAFKDQYSDCYICDVMMKQNSKLKRPSARVWALAAYREEVRGDGTPELGGPDNKGKVLGYRDVLRKVAKVDAEGKPTNEEVEEKAVIVVNQGHKNFFSALHGFAAIYGTCLDRDYVVIRKGEGTATDYQLVPLDPIKLPDGGIFDVRDPDILKRYGYESADAADKVLEEIVRDRASDDYYARFFDPTKTPSDNKGGGGGNATEATSEEPSEDTLAELRNRIQGYAPGGDAPAAAPEAPAQEAQPAAAAPATGMRSFD